VIVFSLICALLILLALGFILPPLRHPDQFSPPSTMVEANVAVYRRQLAEMEWDLRHGLITNEQFLRDREELEERAIRDLPKESPAIRGEKQTVRSDMFVVCLVVGVPLTAILLYVALGTPPSVLQLP
jgi:cytochrome c-type biogenesis protein CcmH